MRKKVEENEQERRAQNFIIYGADEIGNYTDEIKKNDIEYIANILMKIDVNSQTESVNRLGRPNETNKRTIKIVMKSKTDQENVMALRKNLVRLESHLTTRTMKEIL